MDFAHKIILCIVNEGFSETVMSAARNAGASGGTILRAHGTANPQAEKLFNITIQPEKELILIVVPSAICDSVLHAIYKETGPGTPCQGIAFALPVDEAVGIKTYEPRQEAKESTETKG